jgi:hypothetical protein
MEMVVSADSFLRRVTVTRLGAASSGGIRPGEATTLCVVLLTALTCSAQSAQTAVKKLPPGDLHRALLTTPIAAANLPSGFTSARVVSSSPEEKAKKHHALGQILIFTRTRWAAGEIGYVVFPTRRDALATALPYPALSKEVIRRRATPSSFPRPGQITVKATREHVLGKIVKVRSTEVEFVDGDVAVAAVITSTSNAEGEQVAAAIHLAQFALRHLRTVRGS